ncbi:MAG: triphosphoribosyl-dephospho-CoA synthase [Methanimicrococcus sp.]|nr:triphosphoribosyl-dephospho-CoA synthase [Methanimicrococcus sp.]
MKTNTTANEEKIAMFAATAMSLEVSSYPKPGNVHRLKDFKETTFEHFLISALSAISVFLKAPHSDSKTNDFGSLFYEAVLKSQCFQSGGNTHFGTLILLLPLSMAAGLVFNDEKGNSSEKTAKKVIEKAADICKKTTVEDAIGFYKAFEMSNVSVQKIGNGRSENKTIFANSKSSNLTNSKTLDSTNSKAFDLTNSNAVENIQSLKTSLFDLMKRGAQRDMIAKEWVTGFEKSALFSKKLIENKRFFEKNPKKCYGSFINSAVVYTFMEFLAEFEDTFIMTKFNQKKASKIRMKASKIIKKDNGKRNLIKMIPKIQQLDRKMQKDKINPGSLADIAAAGIFISLLDGMAI